MNQTVVAAGSLVLAVIIVSLLARSISGESALGSFATATVSSSCQKLLRESEFARSMSRQDEEPVIALVHNCDALSTARCARKIAEEYSIPISPDLLDAIEELVGEQDVILQNI
jgi:hypothetical protein